MPILRTHFWITIVLILGISGNLLAVPKPAVNSTPEQVARGFYEALSRGDCQTAIQLRVKYSLSECRRMQDLMRGDMPEFKNFTITSQTDNTVSMDVTYYSSHDGASREIKMTGFNTVLIQSEGSWMIMEDSLEQRLNPSSSSTTDSYDSQPTLQPKPTAQLPIRSNYPPDFQPVVSQDLLGKSIRSVTLDQDKKWVALTFDLCEKENERAGYDRAVVTQLIENQIKATFYAGGKWMQSHPQETKELMTNPLFEIGNHTWSHGNLAVLRGEDMQQQILKTQSIYEEFRQELAGHQTPEMRTVRFPYGRCNRESLNFLRQQQLLAIQWDIVTADPSPKQTARGIINIVKKQVKPGSIIIAHANGRGHGTAGALKELIPWLRRQGYEFVTVSDLLQEAREVEATDTCYELSPGDNARYDKLFKRFDNF
jgi:peptidoglycan/xylan/chitin deacetylase (PgdA/CDA1 family)